MSEPGGKGPTRPRWKTGLFRTGQALAGLVVGLIIAELLLWWRADGAFPHVNLYVPDAELGVRLQPGGEQYLKFRDNPRSHIRINSAGYRGDELPPPVRTGEGDAGGERGEILVVGDSQVFGLGVEEDETFSAHLAEITGRTVINGGVPTYGPLEYTAVVREMMDTRKPATVVYVVNFVNDLFEADRPNRDRHAVWDGWAVRSETAPRSVSQFPGRKWLFSRSHAFYAARRWLYDMGERPADRGFRSEGTWRDLVSVGAEVSSRHRTEEDRVAARNRQRAAQLDAVRDELQKTEQDIEAMMMDVVPELAGGHGDKALRLQAATGSPGDIVSDEGVEEGRSIALTAYTIRLGVLYRNRLEAQLARGRKTPATDKILASVATRKELEHKRLTLHSRPIEQVAIPSVLEPRLREVAALVRDSGAELVVVALPIDVQVSADEWKKYGVDDAPDMAPTRVLLSDLVASAEQLGVRAIDVTDALAGVLSSGQAAFLDHDIHMTPAGHRAVAGALAEKLAEPPPLPRPGGGLPDGRTRVPDPAIWRTTPEAIVHGSTKARCETMYIGEWFRATCLRDGRRHVPSGIDVTRGGHGEAMTVVTDDAATLVTPLLRGEEFTATFHWTTHSQDFVARWPDDRDRPLMWFKDRVPGGKPLEVDEDARMLCECHKQVEQEKECVVEQGWPTGECTLGCFNLYGAPSRPCLDAYRGDCPRLLACMRGDPSALPPCPPGYANAGGNGQCFALCSDSRPCAEGACTPWQGARICR